MKKMPIAKKQDCCIYYEIKGQGKPLIFINGFTNHLGMWDHFIPTLEHDFQILRFDNRGAGRSDTPHSSYSIDQMADDLVFLLDTLSIDKADMIGFAMGSVIIQSIALRYPNRLNQAIMISPFVRFPTNAYMQARNLAKLRDFGIDFKLLVEKTLPWIYSSTFLTDPRCVQQAIEEFENTPYPQSSKGYHCQLEALYAYDATDQLDQITHPILLIAGDQDLYTPIHEAQLLKEKLQNVKLEILSGVGHMGYIERKNEVLNLALTWLLQK